MRVAHVSYHYYPIVGGQEVYIQNLIKILKHNDVSSDVFQPINRLYHYFSKSKVKNVKLVFNIPFIGRLIPYLGKLSFNFFLLFLLQ